MRFEELLTAVTRERRYGLSAGPRAPAARGFAGGGPPWGRHADAAGVSEVQRNLWLRHSVFRRLVDDPVVYYDELSADERAYLTSPTGRQLARRAAEQAGFVLEERAEGVLLVDVDSLATDTRFPDDA